MRKNIRYLILLCLCIICLTGCGADSSEQEKKILIGTNAEFPPFEYINTEGEIDGFDMAVMRAIGEEMGYEVEFSNMEFKSLIASLKTGGIDAVAAGMTVTEERKQSVDFTNCYYTATQSIILPIDSQIKTIQELNGKKIAVQEGTTGDLICTYEEENEIIKDSSTKIKRFKKGADAVMELKNGGVDAVVIDSSPAKNFVSLNSNTLKCVPDDTSTEEYAFAVAKGNEELLSELNQGLEIIRDDGTFEKLVDEYISGNANAGRKTSDNAFVSLWYQIKYVFWDTNGISLLLNGLGITIGISLAAVFLGILLGFIIAMMKMTEVRKKRKTLWSRLANFYIDVLRGTPVMVQLLIIYMIVFQNRLGILAAIITFGLNSGAYVAENIRAGIMAVDVGQMEGGRSLGFSYGETMRYIVLPQAIKNALPALGNEFITLVKETSIVGYVAIMDITKAADFIISRTYETFLPLITIAIIYYVIIKILTKVMALVERRLRKSDKR